MGEVVGRRRERRALDSLLQRASAGEAGLLVVVGPPGSGTTTLADAGVAGAAALELVAERWSADAIEDLAQSAAGPRLIVIDEPDRAGLDRVVGASLAPGTAVLVTSRRSLGAATEVVLAPMTVDELAEVVAARFGFAPESIRPAVDALWLASGGRPGRALELAADLLAETGLVADAGSRSPDADPIVVLALRAASTAEYLDVDPDVVRLLEEALARAVDPDVRARLLARLASELLGDASAGARRRSLADEALALARRGDDAGTLAVVLDARLHALWDAGAAADRLVTSTEIVELARRANDRERERRGLFWRFVALVELGRIAEAEVVLAAYERTSAGDPEATVVVSARRAVFAILRGRYDVAERLIERVAVEGRRIGLADTDRLVGTMRGAIIVDRGPSDDERAQLDEIVQGLLDLAGRLPGHHFESVAAVILLTAGRTDEAATELQRQLTPLLAGSGPRWLSAMADLSLIAAEIGDADAAAALYERLVPYRGDLVIRGGANTIVGPVSYHLGRLAGRLGDRETAVALLQEAAAWQEEVGALPGLARSLWDLAEVVPDPHTAHDHRERARSIADRLGAPYLLHRPGADAQGADRWVLVRDGDDWALEAGDERARLRDTRGVAYLRALLGAPGQEISALDLVADGRGLVAIDESPALDAEARRAYRRRLDALDGVLDDADRSGDADAAVAAAAERQAILDELRRSTGLGGRTRAVAAEAERARVNVTRTLRATVDRILAAAPRCGAHLAASITTGRRCCYQPTPDGPSGWRL